MRPYPLESWPNPTTSKKLVNTQHSTSFQLCGRHIGLSAVYAKRYGVKQLSRTHCCGVSVSPGSQVTERILLLILQNRMMIGNLCNNDKDNLEQLQRLCLRVMLPDDDNYGDRLSHLNPEYWQYIWIWMLQNSFTEWLALPIIHYQSLQTQSSNDWKTNMEGQAHPNSLFAERVYLQWTDQRVVLFHKTHI